MEKKKRKSCAQMFIDHYTYSTEYSQNREYPYYNWSPIDTIRLQTPSMNKLKLFSVFCSTLTEHGLLGSQQNNLESCISKQCYAFVGACLGCRFRLILGKMSSLKRWSGIGTMTCQVSRQSSYILCSKKKLSLAEVRYQPLFTLAFLLVTYEVRVSKDPVGLKQFVI